MQVTFEGKTLADVISECMKFLDDCTCAGQEALDAAVTRHLDGDTSTEQTQPADTPAPAPDSDATIEDVAAALKAHMKKHGKDSAINILGEFDARRASEVAKEQRGAIISRLSS